jgi:uncharacterized coiled-coil protein SlyX
MEPQIVDHYNELPHSVNVIDKMNSELSETQNENEKLKDKYETLISSFDTMKEFIETNYEGSEVVSSEYTKMCEDVLNLYKDKYGKEIEEKYMKEYNEKENKEWGKGLNSFINMTM